MRLGDLERNIENNNKSKVMEFKKIRKLSKLKQRKSLGP